MLSMYNVKWTTVKLLCGIMCTIVVLLNSPFPWICYIPFLFESGIIKEFICLTIVHNRLNILSLNSVQPCLIRITLQDLWFDFWLIATIKCNYVRAEENAYIPMWPQFFVVKVDILSNTSLLQWSPFRITYRRAKDNNTASLWDFKPCVQKRLVNR